MTGPYDGEDWEKLAGEALPGTCSLCNVRFPPEEILEHLRTVHDVTVELVRWPDGQPVVLDTTLEPEDFDDR